MNIDVNTTFLNHTLEKLLKYLKQTTDERPFNQTSILKNGKLFKILTKPEMTEFLPSDVSAQINTS